MTERILVIDDEESIRISFESFLLDAGFEPISAENYDEALSLLQQMDFDLIFADILLGGRSGIELLREIKEKGITCPVVMITGAPDIETASEAVRLGAFDYLSKPVKKDAIIHVTGVALQYKAAINNNERYRSNLEAIFRSVKDAIITVDRDLVVVEVNEAARNVCGFTRDIIGKSFSSLQEYCNGKCLEVLEETIKKKRPVEMHRLECHSKERPQRIVTLTASPLLDRQSVFSGAVLVIRDETRLSSLERDLGERRQLHNIIGGSEKMQKIYTLIENLADVQTTVLITGDSGTGKELVAEAIHYRGVRTTQPLVKVNCSALSENLLESELFGHVRGAFTGAIKDKIGRFQRAHGGTIFLDEIGDLSARMQLRLLRVLQEKEFERVGDSTPIRVDVRVIAATNHNLAEMVKRGEFREDLYYRLKVMQLALPALRERREDIPLLVDHFLQSFNARFGKHIHALTEDVQRLFMAYHWPGNVRELEHTLEHAFILCNQHSIAIDHLPNELKEVSMSETYFHNGSDDSTQKIIQALEKTDWNKAKAARLLGVSRRTLYRKIEEYGITKGIS